VTDPSKYGFEPVWEDGEFTLSRNVRHVNPLRCWLGYRLRRSRG
jgi:hypothetical protein